MEIDICDGCGGRVEFSPQDKALKCINCGNLYPIEHAKNVTKHRITDYSVGSHLSNWGNEVRSCKCENCGAQITLNKYDIATKCQYCNANTMVELEELPGLKPEKIIPFAIDKTLAKDEFKKRVLKRKFLPNDFKKNLPNTELGSTYLSSFVFDCFVSATYRGTQEISRTVRDRDGSTRTITETRHFSGKIDRQFNDVVIEASDKINQNEILEVFPYNFADCYDYKDDFIKGYNVGYYNQSVVQAENSAKEYALECVKDDIRGRYNSIRSLDVYPAYSNVVYNYTLLPAYFVTFKYKNQPYINIMNGQTGKIGGKVPRSGTKITLFTLFILLIIGLPILLIALCN